MEKEQGVNKINHQKASINASEELAWILSEEPARAEEDLARILSELARAKVQNVYQADMLKELARFLSKIVRVKVELAQILREPPRAIE